MSTKSAFDPIIDTIIEALEKGVAPWRQTWETCGGLVAVRNNLVPFTGFNQLTLSLVQSQRGYTSPVWLTYNQAQEAGGQVRKGERNTPGLLFKQSATKDSDDEVSDAPKAYAKVYALFNACQCDGLPAELMRRAEVPSATSHDVIDLIEACGMTIVQDGSMPRYNIMTDRIHMPPAAMFETMEEWVGTALHECAHGTGAPSRLNRTSLIDYTGDNRSIEELVAELSAYRLATALNFPPSTATQDNHIAYLAGWAEIIKRDRAKLAEAAALSQRAVDYILSKRAAMRNDFRFSVAA